MFSHQHYVPILKWKMGEYQALHRLHASIKDSLTPLIEIPSVGYDFESERDRKTIDDHLGDFGRRLKSKWQNRACFVDLKYIPQEKRMADGKHYVASVFADVREHGGHAIPVVSLDIDTDFVSTVHEVVSTDRKGVCVRLSMSDFDRSDLLTDLETIMHAVGTGWGETDLIIDLGGPNYLPIAVFVRTLSTMVSMIPALNRWRTFTIAGTSYPNSVADIDMPFKMVPRQEWIAYRKLIDLLGSEARIPTFADYACARPDLIELDMRLISPFAKLRYTIDDAWHIGRGTSVRKDGFDQYRQLCADVVAQNYFDGPSYSAGDQYISECAAGSASTGNLTTWVWVSSNRHLTKVVADLATFHGFSIAA